MNVEKLGFAQRQRLTYIESVAYWEGKVDRPRVVGEFNVSENHVTKDFRLYKDAFPGNIQYDETSRAYRPSPKFKPRIGRGSAEEYLSLLRTQAERRDGSLLPAITSAVVSDAVPPPQGKLESSVLNAVTRAISSGTGLAISYQSKNRPEPVSHRVWPHALLFNGTRWHARAYDQEHQGFIDLVLQRISKIKAVDEVSPIDSTQDLGWSTWVTLDVIPSRSLSASQAEVVAREFGMTPAGRGWVWSVRLRECLAGYFIYLHRLDVLDDPRRVIELKEPDEAKKYLESL
jgi:predicted DNA-binding transcriptional regulator YafY